MFMSGAAAAEIPVKHGYLAVSRIAFAVLDAQNGVVRNPSLRCDLSQPTFVCLKGRPDPLENVHV